VSIGPVLGALGVIGIGVVVAVNEAFSRAGIEIPFPQRVVRVVGERDRADTDALLAGVRPGR
jgi:small-conductance mechanosensitive channel